jgi:hypothetical protein
LPLTADVYAHREFKQHARKTPNPIVYFENKGRRTAFFAT